MLGHGFGREVLPRCPPRSPPLFTIREKWRVPVPSDPEWSHAHGSCASLCGGYAGTYRSTISDLGRSEYVAARLSSSSTAASMEFRIRRVCLPGSCMPMRSPEFSDMIIP